MDERLIQDGQDIQAILEIRDNLEPLKIIREKLRIFYSIKGKITMLCGQAHITAMVTGQHAETDTFSLNLTDCFLS